MAFSQPQPPDEARAGLPGRHQDGSHPLREPAPASSGGPTIKTTGPDQVLGQELLIRCRRMVWIPAVVGLCFSFGGWLAVPHLFVPAPDVTRHLQIFYALLGLESVVFVGLVSILGSTRLRRLARAVGEGRTVDAAVIAGSGREVVRLPFWIGGAFVLQSFILSFGTALRGHLRFELPQDVMLFATIFGVGLGTFGGFLVGALLRMQMAPFTRVLSRLGVERWPGRQRRFTMKVAAICGLVAFLPAFLTGAVGYYFGDRLITSQIAGNVSLRLVQSLGDFADEPAAAREAVEIERRLDRLATRLHPSSDMALIRDDSIIASTSPDLESFLYLRAIREMEGRAGHTVAPDTRCLLVLALLPRDEGWLLLRIPRDVVTRTLRPMQATMVGLIITTMLLATLLGWVSARTMQTPLSEVARITTRVARGDLSDPGGRVLTDDAFGELTAEVTVMRSRLAGTVRRVVELSREVGASAQTTIEQAQKIGLGSEAQVAAVESVGKANDALEQGLREVAATIRRVAATFHDATESGARVDSDFDDLTRDVEALASEASEAASAVGELSKGMASVAEDVAVLSEAAERANEAAGDVDKALSRMRVHAGGAAEAAKRSITAAKGGAESVRRTVDGIGRIREGSEKAVMRVENLSTRISEVDQVLAVIDDIAEKTKLLALNASIIAAQAGEQGRSFAVVASEVRDLAARTASSTREIAGTIQDVREASRDVVGVIRSSGARVEEGVTLAGEAEQSLEEILETAYETSAAAGEIAMATDLQSRKVSDVREEVDQVANMAARIAAVGETQAGVAAGARRAAERIASLTVQVNHVIASLTERNRTLLSTFTEMSEPVDVVDATLEQQAAAMAAITRENARIHDVATASADLAERLDESARIIDEAAEALAAEVRYFRL